MPEEREAAASGKQAQEAFNTAQEDGEDFVLEDIAVDATEKEAKRRDAPERAKEGLVYCLDATSSIKRGQSKHQTEVYPPTLRATPQNPTPPSLSTLVLQEVTYTHRALLLHFGTLVCMLQYLTHTNVQFYPREMWNTSIMNVSKSVRKFHIGMAFIFASHVLAFPTIDLVFQPNWATSASHFIYPPNIFPAPPDFLALVADFIDGILLKPDHKRACDSIRGLNDIFYGIGVYTVMELFFMAGLSPFLTVYEVFSVPSRAARFILAFYCYVARTENDVWGLLKPCIHNGILAPTIDQRLRYADWLFVWAKERTSVSLRMASLVDEYHAVIDAWAVSGEIWCRNSPDIGLFDVFEPTFLASALQTEHNLGHLIFGEALWRSLGSCSSKRDDPITAVYRKHGLLNSPTMLKLDAYKSLILPHAEFRGKRSLYRPTFAYRGPKEMWSVTRDFPPNCHWSADTKMQRKSILHPSLLTGSDRDALLFKNIVTSSLGVAIGPLEYCGIGHIVHIGGIPRPPPSEMEYECEQQ
ncbi:hypothetical protein R3P38DRAFT_1946623 [Favolaschia claudopus]|uniref:Uncharacterized protein n=1 Tax=Favolaschia claudopus TaxID=2862362 RepID=A0AAW0A019_9AGAR